MINAPATSFEFAASRICANSYTFEKFPLYQSFVTAWKLFDDGVANAHSVSIATAIITVFFIVHPTNYYPIGFSVALHSQAEYL